MRKEYSNADYEAEWDAFLGREPRLTEPLPTTAEIMRLVRVCLDEYATHHSAPSLPVLEAKIRQFEQGRQI